MANRTYLYITDSVEKRGEIRGIAEYNYAFPLLFKILCSSLPRAEKSSICILEEKIAVISDMSEGIDKLKAFLLKMKDEKTALSKGKALVSDESYENIEKFLDKDSFILEGYKYFLLEAFELYEMGTDSYEEFERLTLGDIEQINNINKNVDAFMETGELCDVLHQEIETYEKFQYELNSFSEYLYYDFSDTYSDTQYSAEETTDYVIETRPEIPAKPHKKRLMGFKSDEIMFMLFFLLIFPPLGIYFCYDGFRGKYDDRYTSGIILGLLGSAMTLFYLWKIFDFLIQKL